MLSREENIALTHVESGAPMGSLIERYWLPATRSEELAVDGAPLRVRLLGRDLVAFRASDGAVGVLDEPCPHRGASLALARNENCALQCLYHGWRIATDGTVIETPSEPAPSLLKDRVRANAYPVWEAGGLVWTYLGPPGEEPAKPAFEFTALPADQIMIVRGVEYCNWLQCLEGAVDSAHLNWLHANLTRPGWSRESASGLEIGGDLLANLTADAARVEVRNTSYGFQYGAIRRLPDRDDVHYVRATEFVMPFHSNFPGAAGHWAQHQIFVPIDDRNTMFFYLQYKIDGVAIPDEERPRMVEISGVEVGPVVDGRANSSSVDGSPASRWRQDRAAMQAGRNFSGLAGINVEDFVVQESLGQIYDRSSEHLGMSDVAVIRLRRVLLDSLRRLAAGEAPSGLAQPVPYDQVRGGEGIIACDAPWDVVLPSAQQTSATAG